MKEKIEITGQTNIQDLVTHFPPIITHFNEQHIDYCCKWDQTLEAAAKEAGLSTDFITEVQVAYSIYLASPPKELPVTELTDEELIDLILEIHHKPERDLWMELDKLINEIFLIHYNDDKKLLMNLHLNFSKLKMGLEEHFVKEEEVLFPIMRKTEKTIEDREALRSLIHELDEEHLGAGFLIKRMSKDTDKFTPPEFACPAMKTVYAKIPELADNIFHHIAKENSVLFKRYL